MNSDFSQNLPIEENFRAKRRHPSRCSRIISKPCKVFAIIVCVIILVAMISFFVAAVL